ncbi:MAG: ADP-ribosylation factor-like protein [Candidatus Hermodarchaeota archaeon]
MEYLSEEKKEAQKILFTGLDDAGKTSIILALQREFSKIAMIKPTKGAQRKIFRFLDKEISEWDLGGQASYRISYLKNPSKFFAGTEIAIYVIDIQNQPRINESLSYLADVTTEFKKLDIHPPINIFFHKFDPTLIKEAHTKLTNLSYDLVGKIKDSISYNNIYFYYTSIYNIPSIMKAMSEILLKLYTKPELTSKTIQEFALKLGCEGLLVIDNNSLIVGSYSIDNTIQELLYASAPYFLSLHDTFQQKGFDENEDEKQMIIQKYGKYFLFKQIIIQGADVPYYLLIVKNESLPDLYKLNETYNEFINIIKEIVAVQQT